MKTNDRVFEAFMETQRQQGLALDADSDIVDLLPLEVPGGGPPPQRYIVELHCRGLVQTEKNEIREWTQFRVGIHFPSDYLRSVDPYQLITWLGPPDPEHPNTFTFHPNISTKAPLICVGHIAPATPLTDLIHQIFEIVSYQRFTPVESDSLNRFACSFARANPDRFPLDDRPLKRRNLDLEVEQT